MTRKRGFTLIELMIAVATVGILVAIALPSYQREMRKSRRAEAQRILGEMRMTQERWRADNPTYGTLAQIGNPGAGSTHYTFTVADVTATTYTVTATAIATSPQNSDYAGVTQCSPLSLSQAAAKLPADCWQQ